MSLQANGLFDVQLNPQKPDEPAGDPGINRLSINKQFHGMLDGHSTGQMLSVGAGIANSAGYVAIERFSGTLNGQAGTFALQHTGIMTRGTPQLTISIVPDSGTDQLVGIAGTMTIEIVDDKHLYTIDYTLDQ